MPRTIYRQGHASIHYFMLWFLGVGLGSCWVIVSLAHRMIRLQRTQERQQAISEGLLAVLSIADELMACPDLDGLLKRAVELARDRLGLERCRLFVEDESRALDGGGDPFRGLRPAPSGGILSGSGIGPGSRLRAREDGSQWR